MLRFGLGRWGQPTAGPQVCRVHRLDSPPFPRKLLFELLEQRLLLSADLPVVEGLAASLAVSAQSQAQADPPAPVVNLSAASAAAQQVVFLDFNGARDVTYNGPVLVSGIDVPAFRAPAALEGQEAAISQSVLDMTREALARIDVVVTAERPNAGTEYSTVHIGGDGAPFAQYGSFYGLSEKVDAGNSDHSDNAFVFSEAIPTTAASAQDYARELAGYVMHETGHLLGYDHLYEPHSAAAGPLAEVAFKPYTHIEIAKDVRADLLDDGKVVIADQSYTVHPKILEALEKYPSYYYAGNVGPDGFPDLAMGQSLIHPLDTGIWLQRLLDMAWAAQTSDTYTDAEKLQILAWSYGYLTHAAGDLWAHTLVNEFSEGVFPAVREIANDDRDLANAVRHLMVEAYVGDATPGFDNNSDRTTLPNGDISDNATHGVQLDAPVRFIYEALIQPFHAPPTNPDPTVTAADPDGSRGVVLDFFFALRARVHDAATLSGTRPAESLEDLVKIIVGGGSVAPTKLLSAYLYDWVDQIDSGIQHWGELGLAVSRGLFDAQSRRDLQNIEGVHQGTEADPARADAEAKVGIVDTILQELEDPNGDRNLDDSFIDNHLLPMFGVPAKLAAIKGLLGTFANRIDDEIVGPLRLALNPIIAAIDELKEIPKKFIEDQIRLRYGVDPETLEMLSSLASKMDVASVTINSETIPVFMPGDHAKIDGYMHVIGAANSEEVPDRVQDIPGVTFYPGATGFLNDNVEFDKLKFAAYANSVTLSKLLLLSEDDPMGGPAGAPGQLSQLIRNMTPNAGYDFGLLNLNGSHGGNIMTATLPMPGVTVTALDAQQQPYTKLADARPWLVSIDTDHEWRVDSRTALTEQFRVHPAGGTDTATWTFANLTPGEYTVEASWLANITFTPSSNAIYEITHSGGTKVTVPKDQTTFPVDDQADGLAFSKLATVTITGSTLQVALKSSADGSVIAGPVRLVRAGHPEERHVIVPGADNGMTGTYASTGTWGPLKYNTGTGNFPLWESDMLREPVFRKLFVDWQNGGANFPDFGDATSKDPNEDASIHAHPIPSYFRGPQEFLRPAPRTPTGVTLTVTGDDHRMINGDLVINQIRGDGDAALDSLTLTVTGKVTITGGAGGGGLHNLSIVAAGGIEIKPDVIIDTRQLSGGTNPVSNGDSGNIALDAPSIVVGQSAQLLAEADDAFAAGDITLSATDAVDGHWFLGISGFKFRLAEALIDIGPSAVIAGGDVQISTLASTSHTVLLDADLAQDLDTDIKRQVDETALLQFSTFAAAVIGDSRSQISVRSGATLRARRNVGFDAEALANAQITTSGRYVGVTYGSANPMASIVIESGALIPCRRPPIPIAAPA